MGWFGKRMSSVRAKAKCCLDLAFIRFPSFSGCQFLSLGLLPYQDGRSVNSLPQGTIGWVPFAKGVFESFRLVSGAGHVVDMPYCVHSKKTEVRHKGSSWPASSYLRWDWALRKGSLPILLSI